MIDLRQGDCLELMKDIEDNSIDCIVSDVPYKIISGGKTKKDNRTTGIFDRNNKIVQNGKLFDDNIITFEQWLPDTFRVLKEKTHCYIMVNDKNLVHLINEAVLVGFKLVAILVWKKNNVTPNKFYMKNCEFIVMLRKGGERWINNMGSKSCIEIPNIIGTKLHPSEKPVELMEMFIGNSTNENDIVLDMFMGSGATGKACRKLNRSFIGIEKDPKYFEIAKTGIMGDIE